MEDFSPLYKLSDLTTLSIKDIEITQSQYDELAEKLDRCSIYSDDTVAERMSLVFGSMKPRASMSGCRFLTS